MNMNEDQIKKVLLTIKSADFAKWYASLTSDEKVIYKKVFDSLHKK